MPVVAELVEETAAASRLHDGVIADLGIQHDFRAGRPERGEELSIDYLPVAQGPGTLDHRVGIQGNVDVVGNRGIGALGPHVAPLGEGVDRTRPRSGRFDDLPTGASEGLGYKHESDVSQRAAAFLHSQAQPNGRAGGSAHARPHSGCDHTDDILADLLGFAQRGELGSGEAGQSSG